MNSNDARIEIDLVLTKIKYDVSTFSVDSGQSWACISILFLSQVTNNQSEASILVM